MNEYVGVWIDQRKAYIVSLRKNGLEIEPDKKESDSFAVGNYAVTVDVKPRDYRFLMFQ